MVNRSMHGKGGMCGRGACVAVGCAWQGGACVAGETTTTADGTQPTGMHSCWDIE